MKITLSSKTLQAALAKGGLSAQVNGEQNADGSQSLPVQKCVSLTASPDGLVVESVGDRINSRHAVSSQSVAVESSGVACVNFATMMSRLQSLATSHNLFCELVPIEGDPVPDAEVDKAVQPVARLVIKVVSQKNRTAFNWSFDSYAPEQFQHGAYAEGPAWARFTATSMADAIEAVAFAASTDDRADFFENVAMIPVGGEVYFAGTDNKRCGIARVAKDKIVECAADERLFVPAGLLKSAIGQFGSEEVVSILRDADGEHVIIRSDATQIRVAMPASSIRQQYPNLMMALTMPTDIAVDVGDRKEFLQAVSTILSSKECTKALYSVDAGKSEFQMRYGDKSELAAVGCEPVVKGLGNGPMAFSNRHVMDVLKRLKGDRVIMSFTPDEKRIRLADPDDANLTYIVQRVQAD